LHRVASSGSQPSGAHFWATDEVAALLSVKDNAIYALQRDLAHARADAGFSRPAQLSQSHAMQEQQFESKDRLLQEMIRNLQSQLRRDSARG
jgi:hypothetical protein